VVYYFIYAIVPDNDSLCHKAFAAKNIAWHFRILNRFSGKKNAPILQMTLMNM
jgi:hypothetical protein